jgi:iron complex transport system ATP-binding protein
MTTQATPPAAASLCLQDVVLPGRLTIDGALVLSPGLTVVVGKNGAGKSTLLDVAAGVLVPPVGTATLGGTALSAWTPAARAARVASLGQGEPSLSALGGLTGLARVAQGLAPRRGAGALLDDATAGRAVAVALELGLTPAQLQVSLASLSYGQRHRVHLARALVDDDSAALLLDEPFAGLDVEGGRLLVAALRARAERKVVVVSVHELERALHLGGRLLGLAGGRVVVDGELPGALDSAAATAIWGCEVRVRVEPDGFVGVLWRP